MNKEIKEWVENRNGRSGKEKLIYARIQTSSGSGNWQMDRQANGVNQAVAVDSDNQTTEGQRAMLPGRRTALIAEQRLAAGLGPL